MLEAGSGSNATMEENERAFRDVMFRPRSAVWTPERDLRSIVLGHELSMPATGVSGLVLTVDTATVARPRDRGYRERASVPAAINLREALRFAPQALAKPRWLADYVRRAPLEPRVAMGLRPDGTPMGLFEGIEKIYQRTPAWEDIATLRVLTEIRRSPNAGTCRVTRKACRT